MACQHRSLLYFLLFGMLVMSVVVVVWKRRPISHTPSLPIGSNPAGDTAVGDGTRATGAPSGSASVVVIPREELDLLFSASASLRARMTSQSTSISFEDIYRASGAEGASYFGAWLSAGPSLACSSLRWIGTDSTPEAAWPLCEDIPIPHPSACRVYVAGVEPSLSFEVALAVTYSCQVRAFDGAVGDGGELLFGDALHLHGAILAGHNDLDAAPPYATLLTMMAVEYEQGFPLYVLKVDCGDCALSALPQLLADLGPDINFIDHLLVRLPLEPGFQRPHALAGIAALAMNSGFRIYWLRALGDNATVTANLAAVEGWRLDEQAPVWNATLVSDLERATVIDIAMARDAALVHERSYSHPYLLEVEC